VASSQPQWVDDDEALAAVLADLIGIDVVAIDTEFHRERTYFPKLALLQLAWCTPGGRQQVVLVDPLTVSLEPFSALLTGPTTILMHAAGQDLEVLELASRAVPARLYDTQVAAGFLGYGTPSLASLVEGELGVRLPKGDRLTDWLRRPLSAEQLAYAASDVTHLEALRRRQVEQLTETGRLDWALDECEMLRARSRAARDPEEAWLRIKEARPLRGKAAGAAQGLAAWRERRAAAIDQPVRFVLGDLGLVGIAQRQPTSVEQLRGIRGLDDRHARGRAGQEIIDAVARGVRARPDRPRPDVGDNDRKLRPAVSLVSAWLSQLSRDLRIDAALLATRSDIEAFLAGTDGARLTTGWRADVVGEPIKALVEGRAALAFDGHGGLLLEPRPPTVGC